MPVPRNSRNSTLVFTVGVLLLVMGLASGIAAEFHGPFGSRLMFAVAFVGAALMCGGSAMAESAKPWHGVSIFVQGCEIVTFQSSNVEPAKAVQKALARAISGGAQS